MNDLDTARAEYGKALEKLGGLAPDVAADFPQPADVRVGVPPLPPGPAVPGSQAERPRSRGRGLGRVYQRGAIWWVQYSHRGKAYRQSSESSKEMDAVRLLRRKLGEIGRGRLIGPDVEKTTFEDLAGMLTTDYQVNGRRSLKRMKHAVAHLRGAFGEALAIDITPDKISRYVVDRQRAGAASATVNVELAALRRMFRLGERAGKVAARPHVAMLQTNNTRKGFFEADQFRAVVAHLPADLRAVAEVAYVTGWRVKSEVLSRQ